MRRLVVLLASVALALTGCTAATPPPAHRSLTVTPSSPASVSAAPASTAPRSASPPVGLRTPPVHPTATPGAAGAGCMPTKASMPAGARHAQIADVDGDGRPDTEWAELFLGGTVYFGITTASGATISSMEEFAGGGDRSFVVGKLRNGLVIAIPSEFRSSPLWSFAHCTFRPVGGRYDPQDDVVTRRQFVFTSQDNGGAAGCLDGRLVGFHVRPTGRDHVTVTAEHVSVSRNGLHASTGGSSVVLRDVRNTTQSDFSRIKPYRQVSCGASLVLHP